MLRRTLSNFRWAPVVLLLSACASSVKSTGRSVGEGGNSGTSPDASGAAGAGSRSHKVSVSGLYDTAVAPCASGYAHPNICCEGAAYQATSCTEDPAHPFGPCVRDGLAFPDSARCCSLEDGKTCVPASRADAGPPPDCRDPCEPGAYPARVVGPELAQTFACCSGVGLSCSPLARFCSLCPGPAPGYCDVPCPEGWSRATDRQVDLCCRAEPGGAESCFSQSTWISGTGGFSGKSDSVGCVTEQFERDGTSRVMKCDFTAGGTCRCLVNGEVTRTIPGGACDPALCGFPGVD